MSLFLWPLDYGYTENGFVDQPLYRIGENYFFGFRESTK